MVGREKTRVEFKSGLTPFTEAERQADEPSRRKRLAQGVGRRKACRSGQDYNQPGTPETQSRDLRIMGELERQD
jgi:hypothetical protein